MVSWVSKCNTTTINSKGQHIFANPFLCNSLPLADSSAGSELRTKFIFCSKRLRSQFVETGNIHKRYLYFIIKNGAFISTIFFCKNVKNVFPKTKNSRFWDCHCFHCKQNSIISSHTKHSDQKHSWWLQKKMISGTSNIENFTLNLKKRTKLLFKIQNVCKFLENNVRFPSVPLISIFSCRLPRQPRCAKPQICLNWYWRRDKYTPAALALSPPMFPSISKRPCITGCGVTFCSDIPNLHAEI